MAKKRDTKSRIVPRDNKGVFVSKEKKSSSGAELWSIRASDGRLKTVATKPASAESMDRAVKRYAGALKRLAKR